MQTIDLSFAQDPNTLSLALIAGVIPAFLWILFWVRETRARPRTIGSIFFAFLMGVCMVVLALPVEKFMLLFSHNPTVLTVLWAGSEELLKFGAFLLVLLMSSAIESPIDYPIYMMIVALGFSGFENSLYFLQPLQSGTTNILILAGSMRFIGTTLMHAVVSCLPGVALGFAFFYNRRFKIWMAVVGLACAVIGHSLFNLFITESPDFTFFVIIFCVWLATLALLVSFERLRANGSDENLARRKALALSELEQLFSDVLQASDLHPNDMDAILAGLTKKGIAPDAPIHTELAQLISALREAYSIYLMNQGSTKDESVRATQKLIPDTVSPRAIAGIFSVLKK